MMNERYEFQAIERKWQQRWAENQAFAVEENPDRAKFYMLEMLPYPSGELHLGHVRNYSLGDSIARLKSLQGFNVMHPIGWDAFGLPAENAAIERRVPPQDWTLNNIKRMKEQCLRMGFAYDWRREIATCLPEYYGWNQWFFLQMLKRGLAYRKKGQVNWCNQCQTVLANEQAADGLCWRDGSEVVIKDLDQWCLRISEYSEELLGSLDSLEAWPEKVVAMQRNWIGKSEGTQVRFDLESGGSIEIFTTRVDTIFGATFMVVAPEHELVRDCLNDPVFGQDLKTFVDGMRRVDQSARVDETAEKLGQFTGRYAVNPFNGERIPVWVANFVLMEYGTGAIMAVPAHDERDFEFATKYGIPIRPVIRPEDEELTSPLEQAFTEYGVLQNSGQFSGQSSKEAIAKMTDYAEEQRFGSRSITYRLKDWGISRQRYWGTPIPIIYCEDCGHLPVPEGDLPVVLPRIESIELGGSPLKRVEEFLKVECPSCGGSARRETDTMDTFVDSSWYFYRYVDSKNSKAPFARSPIDYWFPVDVYIGGVEHAVMHLIYMRFFTKVMRDLGLVDMNEPVKKLFTQGMVLKDGAKMSKSKGNTVSPDAIVKDYGADALRLFIQFCAPPEGDLDWNDQGLEGCSRFLRRYWRFVHRFHDVLKQGTRAQPGELTEEGKRLLRKLHQTIRKVTEDIERIHQNTAVAAIMELSNTLHEYVDREEPDPALLYEVVSKATVLLWPFTPHIADEIWEQLGHEDSVSLVAWPQFDAELAREEEIEIVIQVNGKVRSKFSAPLEISKDEMESRALADERVAALLGNRTVRKVIVVPGRLVNIVG
jgi:leucyl-tRNA synthetase